MCIGLIMHLFLRRPKKRIALWLLFLSLLTPISAQASDTALDTKLFAKTPILHEGRIKPIGSFARAHKKVISGNEKGAIPWIIEILFNPNQATQRQTIKVRHPDIVNMLGLARRQSKLYSYKELQRAMIKKEEILRPIIDAPEGNFSRAQQELIFLHSNIITIRDLTQSLLLFMPITLELDESTPKSLQTLQKQPLTYFSTYPFRDTLIREVRKIATKKGVDPQGFTKNEQTLSFLSLIMNDFEAGARNNTSFTILPGKGAWYAPWQNITHDTAQTWQNLTLAYHRGDANAWNTAMQEIYDHNISAKTIRKNAVTAEYYYTLYNPFTIGFSLCCIAFALLCAHIYKPAIFLKTSAVYALCSATILQITGIASRIYILERPPVSTLYETVLFVIGIVLLYGLLNYKNGRKIFWLWMCAGLGCLLHILGFTQDQEGDSFIMLSAVLNTNFWLTTHVLCITAGYAFCAMTSGMAHFSLGKMIWKRTDRPDQSLFKHTQTLALIALFFTTIGTVLGGIWADQSWGRFWGWDPKENGALLIVLWLIWVVHGRISGQMNLTGVLYGLSYLSVILALSWFGVNALSVGLHSYGFTDGMLWSLGGFIFAETTFITIAIFALKKARQKYA